MRNTDSKWMERSSREVTNQLAAMNYSQRVNEIFAELEKEGNEHLLEERRRILNLHNIAGLSAEK